DVITVQSQSPFDAAHGETFQSVTVLTQEQLQFLSRASFGDTLATQPGITASTFAPGASRPIIRGLDNFRVRVQENGIGSHDVSALSEDHGVPIDPLAAEKIEVIRGPATLRWGSEAIGGTVSVDNNRIPDAVPVSPRIETRGAHTTVDGGLEGAVLLDAGKGPFALHFDAYSRSADDYSIPGPDKKQANTALQQDGQAVGGSLVFDRGFLGLAYSHFTSLYGIPGEEAAERNLQIDMEQHKLTAKGEYRPALPAIDAVKVWFGVTDYTHDEVEDEGNGKEIGSTFDNLEREGRTEVLFAPRATPFGQATTAMGLHLRSRDLSASGEGGELLAPNTTQSIAGFLFEEVQVTPRLKVQAAGRIEQVDVKGTTALFPAGLIPPPDEPDEQDFDLGFAPASTSLGMLYDLGRGVTFGMTGQYVERAPDTLELFAKGPHEASETFEIGNPFLGKEKATGGEISLRRKQGRLRFDAAAYYTQFEGFIFKRLTGIECNEEFDSCGAPDPNEEILTQIAYSQADATFYGMEASGEFDLFAVWRGHLGIDAQYDRVTASFEDGGAVPRIPPERAGAGLYYRDNALFARVGFLHGFRQDRIAENETPTDGYTLLNAELAYELKDLDGGRQVTVGIVGTNLLDDDVRNHVSFKKEDVLLPGASVKFFARMALN
ncbi:MAG: TonB-dependent receptor, partial [Hyphomicrobiales bacterium]